jgi:hypothetical protein
MRSARGSAISKFFTGFYYISWIFIGNFILLNLFLAILLDAFVAIDKQDEDDEDALVLAEEEAEERR